MGITISGIASGLDVNTIVDGLVKAERVPLDRIAAQKTNVTAARDTLTAITGKLATLRTAAADLANPIHFSSFAASSSDPAVVSTVTGVASTGSFDVEVTSLAREQRTYSDTQTSSTDALGLNGNLSIQVGAGTAVNVAFASSDSLGAIAAKISSSGARVSASVLFDGTAYRLQVRGLDTGAANDVKFVETGDVLGLATPANTFQPASNAILLVDGIEVQRPTNQIVGVIPGVTLAITKKTTTAASINVASDPDALAKKIQTFVSAYNDVVSSSHAAVGFGTLTASSQVLAGDGTVRSALDKLARVIGTPVTGASGKYKTMTAVGLASKADGTLALDVGKLTSALATDPSSVARLFVVDAPSAATGAMGTMKSLIDQLTLGKTAPLANRLSSFAAQMRRMDTDTETLQRHLDTFAVQLRARFTAIESVMSKAKLQTDALNNNLTAFSNSGSSK